MADSSTSYSNEYGYVYEATAEGTNIIREIWFRYATSTDDINCIAYGFDWNGNATRDATVIDAGLLTYDFVEGFWTCRCPFTSCESWKLFIWRKNTNISQNDISWQDGQTIPVSAIVDEINLLRSRAQDDTTDTSRSIRAPELGSDDMFVPPKDARAGHILGFNDKGYPAIGEEVEDYIKFTKAQSDCEGYVEKAKEQAEAAADSANSASQSADRAETASQSASEFENNAADYASQAQGCLQRVEETVETAINKIDIAVGDAVSTIDGEISDTVERAEYAAERAEAAAETATENADSAENSADECRSLVKSITGTFRTVVCEELPAELEQNVFYFVGNDTDGYKEWILADGKAVCIGNTDFSSVAPATNSSYGLVKLSTAETIDSSAPEIGFDESGHLRGRWASTSLVGGVKISAEDDAVEDDGGAIGKDSANKIRVVKAALDTYGVVKLGSRFHTTHSMPYVVGIGASNNSGHEGELAFNLREYQSDGSPGVLKYVTISEAGQDDKYEMYVEEASYSQLGVVKLLDTLDGYTDAQIDAARNTHAASVGLVLDRLDSFCDSFFTEERIYGYFDTWVLDKDLAQQIWDNEEWRGALITNLDEVVLQDEAFGEMVDGYTKTACGKWLTEVITDEHLHALFDGQIESVAESKVDLYWTDKVQKTMYDYCEELYNVYLPTKIAEYMSVQANVESIANLVTETVTETVVKNAETAAVDFMRKVVRGEENMVDEKGNEVSFAQWVSTQINALLQSQSAVWEDEFASLRQSIKTSYSPTIKSVTNLCGSFSGSLETSIPREADVLLIRASSNNYVWSITTNELRAINKKSKTYPAQFYMVSELGAYRHGHDYHQELRILVYVTSVDDDYIYLKFEQSSNSGGSISSVDYVIYDK